MKKFNLTYVVSFGLGCAFLASALRNYFYQESFNKLIESSFFSGIFSNIPYLLYLALFNDFLIANFLMLGIFQKIAAWWAMLWLIVIILIHISVFSFANLIDVIEYIGLLSMTIFLLIKSRKQTVFIPPPAPPLGQNPSSVNLQ